MSFIDSIKIRAKKDIKTIVLPEGNDIRTIEAVEKVRKEQFADVIVLGNKDEILNMAKEHNINIDGVKIINPVEDARFEKFANEFYELRKAKGMTLEKAEEILKDETYFGMMMVKLGYADGLVSGACHSTANTLRPALQILKTAPGTKLVSAFFVMCVPNCEYGDNGTFIFSDSGLNEYPDADSLSEIAISSSKSFEQLVGKKAKVAMLSYSTYGSATSPLTEKVVEATSILKEKAPDLICDGELQLDAAIIPEIAESKAPGSPVAGQANTLIFPDLDAGNIAYKITERLAHADAYGPVTQGLAKPVNDLSRGCSADDIVGVVAITALQAENNI